MARVALIILMNSRQLIYQEKLCVTSNILQLTYNVPCEILSNTLSMGIRCTFYANSIQHEQDSKETRFHTGKKLSKAQERNLQLEGADITTQHRKRPDQHVLSKCWSYSLQTRVKQSLTEALEKIFRTTNRPSDIVDYNASAVSRLALVETVGEDYF